MGSIQDLLVAWDWDPGLVLLIKVSLPLIIHAVHVGKHVCTVLVTFVLVTCTCTNLSHQPSWVQWIQRMKNQDLLRWTHQSDLIQACLPASLVSPNSHPLPRPAHSSWLLSSLPFLPPSPTFLFNAEAAQTSREKAAEIEAQQALQSLQDRQQMAFEVCDRMFNALLAWATTKDVRYLLAAQRSLTAVQNQEGDTLVVTYLHLHVSVYLYVNCLYSTCMCTCTVKSGLWVHVPVVLNEGGRQL